MSTLPCWTSVNWFSPCTAFSSWPNKKQWFKMGSRKIFGFCVKTSPTRTYIFEIADVIQGASENCIDFSCGCSFLSLIRKVCESPKKEHVDNSCTCFTTFTNKHTEGVSHNGDALLVNGERPLLTIACCIPCQVLGDDAFIVCFVMSDLDIRPAFCPLKAMRNVQSTSCQLNRCFGNCLQR